VGGGLGQAKCKCGKTKAKGLMIQCDSCTSWSHAKCVGLTKVLLPLLLEPAVQPSHSTWGGLDSRYSGGW
jgi:hypothetical protein